MFSPHVTKKHLVAALRPDPLGELKRSHRPTSRSGCHGRKHSLAAVMGACCEEGKGGLIEKGIKGGGVESTWKERG